MDKVRFVPKKRTDLKGRVWWVVFDKKRGEWSSYTCHGLYKTKRDCQWAIDYYNNAWFVMK